MVSLKKISFAAITLFIANLIYAHPSIQPTTGMYMRIDTVPEQDTNALKVFDKVEIEASFAGGEQGWRDYLIKNLNANTPVDNGAPGGTYTVWVQFIVDKDGKTSDFKALTKHGYGMETEVIRILRKCPLWTPAEQEGRKVKAYRKQPVTFMVIEDKKKRRRNRD